MRTASRVVLALALLCTACGNDNGTSTTAPSTTTPVTETFASVVTPLGQTSRTFSASQAGSLTASLISTDPPATVGFGIGIPRPAGGCFLNAAVNGTPGAQLTSSVDAGSYCVVVYDPGALARTVNFTVSIVHP